MMKEQLAIIGASSMVGSQFCQQYGKPIIKGDQPQVDITKSDLLEKFFAANQFSTVILFSAFTDVTAAEKQRGDREQRCWQINVEGVTNVVLAAKKYNRKLIFISTDFVFDGTKGPYSEDDETGPNLDMVSWYGITKIEGEKIISKNLSNYIILRIAYPYSGKDTGKNDLVLRIAKLYKEGKLYKMYTDQTITPTYIPDIAPAVELLIDRDFVGIVHLASPVTSSHYEIAKELIEKAKLKGPKPLEQKSIREDQDLPQAVPRPKDGGLKVDKIKSLGFVPTDIHSGIEKSVQVLLK